MMEGNLVDAEPVEEDMADEHQKNECGKTIDQGAVNIKPHRKRKRRLMQQILQQMEFYFSDANLRRDKFLNELLAVSKDGYVDLNVFLTFNKIKALTDNVRVIEKSLIKSKLLQVSEGGGRVRRVTPPADVSEDDVNRRTIYIEGLKPASSHDELRHQFSVFGAVSYVSLPKYPHSHNSKGFAFIEFERENCAADAIRFFGGDKKSLEEQNVTADVPESRKEDSAAAGGAVSEAVSDSSKPKLGEKRSLEAAEREDVGRGESKRVKVEEEKQDQHQEVEGGEGKSEVMESGAGGGVLSTTGKEEDGAAAGAKRKKHRKRVKRKNKGAKVKEQEGCEGGKDTTEVGRKESQPPAPTKTATGAAAAAAFKDSALRVLSKNDWLSLRREYMKLQRKSMAALKKSLVCERRQPQQGAHEVGSATALTTSSAAEYPPSTIVKLSFPDTAPISEDTVKTLKSEVCRCSCKVAYYDLPVGAGHTTGYVRCRTRQDADNLLRHLNQSPCPAPTTSPPQPDTTHTARGRVCDRATLLQGGEEAAYWSMIRQKRRHGDQSAVAVTDGSSNTNSNNAVRGVGAGHTGSNMVRGRDKLIQKAEAASSNQRRHKAQSHIYFPESDGDDE